MLFFKRAAPPPKEITKYAAAAEDPSSIGNILLKMGVVTPEQVQVALRQKTRFDDAFLGTWLQQLGFVGAKDVSTALRIQAEMRQGSALTAELDMLQVKMDESATHARELATTLSTVRVRRRDKRRDKVECLPIPHMLAKAGG